MIYVKQVNNKDIHNELYSISLNNPENIVKNVSESCSYTPETNITLQINSTSIIHILI